MIGTVILVSLVLSGAVLVVVAGSTVLTSIRDDAQSEQSTMVIQELATDLDSVSRSDRQNEFRLGTLEGTTARVEENAGFINVTTKRWDDPGDKSKGIDCKTNTKGIRYYNSIRYETPNGETVAHAVGGVFKTSPEDEGSSVVSAPAVTFNDGTVSIEVTNPQGSLGGESGTARYLSSEDVAKADGLLSGTCRRPHVLNITIKTEFRSAWRSHLKSEFPVPVKTVGKDDKLSVVFHRSDLPGRVRDRNNAVVNLTDMTERDDYDDRDALSEAMAYYMAQNPNSPTQMWDRSSNFLKINKPGYSGTYQVTVQSLAADIRFAKTGQGKGKRAPLDVVFVVDESGSMEWNANPTKSGCDEYDDPGSGAGYDPDESGEDMDVEDSDCQSKRDAVRQQIKNAVDTYLKPKDRVGLVGFYQLYYDGTGKYYNPAPTCEQWTDSPNPGAEKTSEAAKIYATNGTPLTKDHGAFKSGPVSRTRACGGTNLAAGIAKANAILDIHGKPSHTKVIIVLSDGENTPESRLDPNPDKYFEGSPSNDINDWTETYAERAELEKNYNIFTIGFGSKSQLDQPLLKTVGSPGSSKDHYWYASNTDTLKQAFKGIFKQVNQVRLLKRIPLSSNVQGIGYGAPKLPGDIDDIARDGQYVNINDPTAPTRFRHTFSIQDKEKIQFRSFKYDCQNYVDTKIRRTRNSKVYTVQRCKSLDPSSKKPFPQGSFGSSRMYTDGDDVRALFTGTKTPWWQEGLQKAVNNRDIDIIKQDRDGDPEKEWILDAKSNQALVSLRVEVSGEWNKVVLLVEVGKAESEVKAQNLLNYRVVNVEVET